MYLLRLNRVAFFVLSAFFLMATVFIYFSPHSLVPDEIGFLKIGANYSYLAGPNPEYFGAIFWILISIIRNWFVLRILFFLMYLSSFIVLIKSTQLYKSNLSSFAPFFILSSPIFLWTGKIIDPEFINFFLISLVIYCLHNRAIAISGALLGIALGIKIDSLAIFPATFFLLYLNSPDLKKFVIGAIKVLIFSIFGLIISNPLNFKGYLSAVFSKSHAAMPEILVNLNKLLFSQLWTWDAIQYTGFFNHIVSLPSLVLLLSLLFYKKFNTFLLFIVAFIPSVLLIAHTENVFIWYFFPFIPFLVYCIFVLIVSIDKSTIRNPNRRYAVYALFFSILVNFYNLGNSGVSKLYDRYLFIAHKSFSSYQHHLVDVVNLNQPKLIVNYSDVDSGPYDSIILIGNETRWDSFQFLERVKSTLSSDNAFEKDKLCMMLYSYHSVLFIFDNRLSYNSEIFENSLLNLDVKISKYFNRLKTSCKFDSEYHIISHEGIYYVVYKFY